MGGHRRQTCIRSADYHVKQNNIKKKQSESELTEDGSITNSIKHMDKDLDTVIIFCHYQRLGLYHYLYLRKCNFLIAFI